MRYTFVLMFLVSLPCWTQTTATGQATTNTPCSVANTGSDNKIQINCGIGKEQGQKIITILNKILANHIDTEAVMVKLDEILKAVNPNLPTKTYFCDGTWKSTGPGTDSVVTFAMGDDEPSFKEMGELLNSDKPAALLKVCRAQIDSKPEWLTPRLFCAAAYFQTGDRVKAREMLAEFDAKSGPAYTAQPCGQLSEEVHKVLQ